ncbi:MAG: hypothetical protein H6555_08795 [Lewinellaceae bacterium]|nr:hypothetical protein [Lewinellaceae bacterium]
MNYNDTIGTLGVGIILLAYFLNVFALIPKEGKVYFLLNILGAGIACYASILIHFMPFIILEAVWCVVSLAGLLKLSRVAISN